MIVVDASAVVELLLRTDAAAGIEERLFLPGQALHAPHLMDVEVAQVLRRLWKNGQLTAVRAQEAIEDLAALSISRHPHEVFLARIWELRHAVTAYDAAYLALAEALDAALLTRDKRLAASHGHRARVVVV